LSALRRELGARRDPRRGALARWLHRSILHRSSRDRGVYLWGGVGTGKTMLMDLFHRSLPDATAKRAHYHRFMQSVHDAKERIRDRPDPLSVIAAQLAQRHRVLCLDEFAVSDIADAMILSGLLHHLFDLGVILVTTSNTRPDDLYAGGLQRQRFLPAIESLNARTRVIQVDSGHDHRMDRLDLDALYHVPHDRRAARALRDGFARLERGPDAVADEGERVFELAGREVAAVAVGCGTAWFKFDALCGDGRSKLDYIELSKRFHTVILADIPAFDAESDDAARRLIELIDELYDRGVNLIASAARPPAQLYRGVRLAQPFARTASRLREMASRAYLARPHRP
ncbi:MAG: cell division protein ZapE, partial [bacterium]